MPASLTALAPGCVIAERYEIVETIGEGGMGVVFRVKDRHDGQSCALKILKDTTENQAASERRFRREYRALARLRHPAVVDVKDTGIFEGHLFFAMEHVQGHTLREWGTLVPAGGRSEQELRSELEFYLQTMVTVLDALSDVHRSGIVHRDLKPQNIMIDTEGAVRIMDFGVALEMRAPASETSSNMILGTVGYVSPEEVKGVKLDARADLYSVGAMLYEYVTGEPAFDDDNPILAFSRMLKERPVPPRRINPTISRELEEVILKLLERDADDRFQTAEEAAFALNLCLDGGGLRSSSEGGPTVIARLPALFPGKFIGQQVALHLLGRLLEKSRRGQGKMALVLGEAGIGKTRLLQELWAAEERSQLLFLRGGCFEREGVYYQPYVDMIGEYVRRVGKTSKRDQLMERLYDADLFPLMRELAQGPRAEGDRSGLELPAEERIRLFEAVARLMSGYAERRPVLVHLDDMHHADELTLELTRYLARNLKAAPILLVVSIRPDSLKRPEAAHVRRFLDDMRREGLMDAEVKLTRLSKDEVRDLFVSLVHWEPPADTLEAVFRLTDGIPYFVEEVVKSLVAAGRGAPAKAASDLPIPATVAEIVALQLRSFSAEQREVLRDAAHIGTDFEFDLLLEVSGREEGQLLDLIDDFLRHGVLTEIATARTDSYRFTHPVVREMLLRQVGERKRRKTHLRIATAMEELYHDRLEAELTQHVEEIARQYRLAGVGEKAFEYGWIAAKKAIERRAFDAALRHLTALLGLAEAGDIRPTAGERTEMTLDLGMAYERTGRLSEARELYERDRPRLRRERDDRSVCEVGRRLARIHVEEGRIDDALQEIEGSLSAAPDAATRIGLETEMARLLETRGDHAEAMSVLLTTLQLAESEGALAPMSEAMGMLGAIFTARGEHLEAARYLEKALEIARTAGDGGRGRDPRKVASILSMLAENAHQSMDSALEVRFYEECLAEIEKSRDLLAAVTPLARMGRAYVILGEMDRGSEILRDALERCRRFALTHSLPVALEAMSIHSLYRGKLRSARAELLEAFDQAESVGDVPLLFRVSLSLGALLTLLRSYNEAKSFLEQAMALATSKDNTLWTVQVLTAMAELDVATDGLDQARARLAQIRSREEAMQALVAPKHFIPSYVLEGSLLARAGAFAEAEARFRQAFEGLADVVWPYMLGQCHLRYAQFLRAVGEHARARDEIEKSRRVWNWLGTGHFILQCEQEDRLLS